MISCECVSQADDRTCVDSPSPQCESSYSDLCSNIGHDCLYQEMIDAVKAGQLGVKEFASMKRAMTSVWPIRNYLNARC